MIQKVKFTNFPLLFQIVSLSVEYLVIITVEQSLEQVQADINSLQRYNYIIRQHYIVL